MRQETVILDPVHIAAIQLGVASAVALGIPSAAVACRSGHELWTAALLLHEVAENPFWRVGYRRPARAVATAMRAATRLSDQAIALLAQPIIEAEAA